MNASDPQTDPTGTPDVVDEATGMPAAKIDRKKQVIGGLLTVAVLVLVFVGVFPQFANYGDAWDSIQKLSIGAIIALVVVTIVNILVYVLPYQAALPGLHYGHGFVVRQTSFMISNVVPAGGAFGLGVQYAMLSGYNYNAAATTTAIAATSVWNLLVTLGLPVLGVLILVFQGGASSNEVIGALVGLVAIVLLVGVFALVLRSEPAARRVGAIGDRVVGSLSRRFRKKKTPAAEPAAGTADVTTGPGDSTDATATEATVDDPGAGNGPGSGGRVGEEVSPVEGPSAPGNKGVGDVTASILQFRDQLRGVVADRWGRLTATSFGQQFCQFLILAVAYFGIAGSDGGINPAQLFAAFSLARLAGFIPVTPGGLGTVDAAMVGLMVAMGASKEDALAADLLWRAASYFPQVIIGVITFLIWRKQAGSKRKQKAAAAGA